MSQIEIKNLPKGFEYPLTKNETRDFIQSTGAQFDKVLFCGISDSEHDSNPISPRSHGLVALKTAYDEAQACWKFTLEVNALRGEHYYERRDQIAQKLLESVKSCVEEKLALPATAPRHPTRTHFSYIMDQHPIVSYREGKYEA